VAIVLAVPAPVHAQVPQETWRLPLRITVANVEGHPVTDRPWLEAQVERANAVFAPSGVSFSISQTDAMNAHARLETRADRHALGALVQPDGINVFVVASLRDVDDPSLMRQGVHWRPRGSPPGTHLVIIRAGSGPFVLAHELGHFFGNHQHSDTPGNIMSYDRGLVPPFFDERQLGVIRGHARRFVRSGELLPEGRRPTKRRAPARPRRR
jgi:hypothetical protein